MFSGKQRIARTRSIGQERFDEQLIEEFRLGGRPDPAERRSIRIVHGSDRLTNADPNLTVAYAEPETHRDWLTFDRAEVVEMAGPVGPDDSSTPSLFDSPPTEATELVGQAEVEPAPNLEPTPEPIEQLAAVVSPEPPKPLREVPLTSASVCSPRMLVSDSPMAGDRFELRRFLFGIATGCIAGAILLAVLSLI